MAYSLCSACGAKTLVGATRCPRCQTPLVSYDADAKRPETVRCPSCGVLRPMAIGICPNCHSGPEPATQRSIRSLSVAAGAVLMILVVGFVISKFVGPSEQAPAPAPADAPVLAVTSPKLPDREPIDSGPLDSAHAIAASAAGAAAPRASNTSTPSAPVPTAVPAGLPAKVVASSPLPTASAAGASTPRTERPAPGAPAAAPDSGWTYWRAITWVRLRDKPGRNGEEVRMIDSSQRVMLGPSTNGWRATRVGTDRGWVDPRFFVPATKP